MNVRLIPLALAALFVACAPAKNIEAKDTTEEAAPPPVEVAAPTLPTLRLPEGVRPVRYNAELTVDPALETFDGLIEIELAFAGPTSVVWLNATNLEFLSTVFIFNNMQYPAEKVGQNEDFVGFKNPQGAMAGRGFFRAYYRGKISSTDFHGLFKQKDGDNWYAFTQFEPFYARQVFPCFDEPNFKVPWDLAIKVPEGMGVLSNTPAEAEGKEGNKRRVKFKQHKPIPSYLIAFAVGTFDALNVGEVGAAKRPAQIVTPRGRRMEGRAAAEILPAVVTALEGYFGTALPYDKLDLIAIPMFFGAMENPGLVTFGENILLAPSKEDTLERQRRMTAVIAHELAHFWFGDLVTMKWWDDLWLNESFSDWMANKVVAQIKPDWQMEVHATHGLQAAMNADSLLSAKKIRQPIENKGDIVNAFDHAITYEKGEAVLRMLEVALGEAQFQQAVSAYIKAYAWKNANAEEFLTSISQTAGRDVGPMFKSFIDQPGVPMVKADLDCKGPKPVLKLSQQRYLPVGTPPQQEQLWQLPVCVRYGVGADSAGECTLLTSKSADWQLTQVEGCVDWLYPNDGQKGYYRSAMTPAMLRELLAQDANVLTPAEQVGLLSDLSALVRSGDMPADEVLKLVPKYAQSPNRFVTGAAVNAVESMRYDVVPDKLRPNYQRFVKKTFGARAKKLGLLPGKKDTEEVKLTRPAVIGLVADAGNDAALLKDARKLADKWLKDPQSVPPDMAPVVLHLAGRTADAAYHQKLIDAAKAAQNRRHRQMILEAAGATTTPALVQKNLALIGSNEFDIRESLVFLMAPLRDPKTRDLAYDWVKANWDELPKRAPKPLLPYLMGITAAFCDAQHRDDAKAFFGTRTEALPGSERILANALEAVDQCIAVKAKQEQSVAKFLRSY